MVKAKQGDSSKDRLAAMFNKFFPGFEYRSQVQDALQREFGEEAVQVLLNDGGITKIADTYRKDGIPPDKAAEYIVLKIKRGPKTEEEFEIQRKLANEFLTHGIDFMSMDPVVHLAILTEAILFNRISRTVEMFFETAEMVGQQCATDDDKAAMLVETYRKKLKLLTFKPQNDFDIRNPELAIIVYELKDEIESRTKSSAKIPLHADFIKRIEADYQYYDDKNVEANLNAEQKFNALVTDMITKLSNSEKAAVDQTNQFRSGTRCGFVIILRVVFGYGPGLAKSIGSETDTTTLALLAKILTNYDGSTARTFKTEFENGALWAIAEFCRRAA